MASQHEDEFDSAEKLISKCVPFSAPADNPVQRVVKFFSEALREKVDVERGKIDVESTMVCIMESLLSYQPDVLACERNLPCQVSQFTTIQVILDSAGMAKKIHLVDFGIKIGLHWSIMMQALANRINCRLELLKITAMGTSKDRLEETGKRLTTFAASMSLPFLYKTVVSEMKDFDASSFGFEADEVVAVYLSLHLWSKLAWPNNLNAFVKFVKKLNPCVMVANEIEAKDEERTHRHAKIGYWRGLFAEFGIVEMELSYSSLFQANLLVKICSDYTTLDMELWMENA
ncbi:hypothetical protein BUALT_Bualt12G0113800 [Buddleja alternifolia]|uniref:Uncharacterized protein n=1 Tax=Buddleja alternifolia TaxID=168488 RepID=A0AAV6WXN5_9LAMI|nr:hypothetical protein BUALT_Bualt12G0113800 [Buddleja alternifolia]